MAETYPVSGDGFIKRDLALLEIINGRIGELSGTPVAGTNAVYTLTIGGTPTAGSIEFEYGGAEASATWSSTNATLLANINTALDTLFGAANVNAAAGSLTNGIGTILITFTADLGLRPVTGLTIDNNLTGTAPTASISNTTPGVRPSGYGTPTGGLLPTDNGLLYQNVGTETAPVLASIPQVLTLPLTAATVTTAAAVLSFANPFGRDMLIVGGGTFFASAGSTTPRALSIGVANDGVSAGSGFDVSDTSDPNPINIGLETDRAVLGENQFITATTDGSLAGMVGAYIQLTVVPMP